MRKLTTDERQKIELNELIVLDDFCKKHNIPYYITDGTLLGAVRHKGFIPWDDDIDVVMLRDDYEKLMKLHGEGNGRYRLFSSSIGNMPSGFAKYRDMNVKTIYKYIFKGVDDQELGIDIFPFDNSYDDDVKSQKLWKKVTFNRIMFDICSLRFRNKFLAVITCPFLLPFRIHNGMYWTKRAEKWSTSVKQRTSYMQHFIWGFDGNKEKVPASTFDDEPVMLEFEGHMFPAFSYYKQFLKNMYGDYMSLPPVSKRKVHGIKAWLHDESLGLGDS